MTLASQLARLEELGLAELAGISAANLRSHARDLPEEPNTLLAIHPELVPASKLTPLLSLDDKAGFIVSDMTDLDQFCDLEQYVAVPDRALYLVHDVTRGDDLRNWSPEEALPAIGNAGRTPLTVSEGISWLLQEPKALEPNYCFMTMGSRKKTAQGLDPRTPAIWISRGTGRDGKVNTGAPKVGWCWAGNRHTWLGFASAASRT